MVMCTLLQIIEYIQYSVIAFVKMGKWHLATKSYQVVINNSIQLKVIK